jgi:L-aspartate oxidase
MVSDAGVVRTGSNLSELQLWIAEKREEIGVPHSEAQLECGNLFLLAAALADAAVAREESRGAHFRSDFPETEDSWRVRQSLSRTDDGVLERSLSEVAATIAS